MMNKATYYLTVTLAIAAFTMLYIGGYHTNLPIQNEHAADIRIYHRDSLVHEFKNLPPGDFRYYWRNEANRIEVDTEGEKSFIWPSSEDRVEIDNIKKGVNDLTIHL